MNPCELQIELFCRGIQIDPSCDLVSDARKVSRTRAGLGSGLEMVIPASPEPLWLNAPVEEDFAVESPWLLKKSTQGYVVAHKTAGLEVEVTPMCQYPA